MRIEPPQITFIPCEEHFRPVLPTIEGNVDYLALRGQPTTIDELLRTSGVENEFVMRSLENVSKSTFCRVLEKLKGTNVLFVQGNNLTVNDCILGIECSNRISDGRE